MKFRFSKLTLRTRILVIILLAALPAAGMFVMESSREYQDSYRDAEIALMTVAKLAASNESKVVQGIKDTLLALSQQSFIQNRDLPSCRAALARMMPLYPAYDNFSLIDLNGNVLCTGIPFDSAINVKDRPYFQVAMREKRFDGGNYLVSRVTGFQAAHFILPLVRDGEFYGAITTALRLEAFTSLVRDIDLPEGTTLLITDAQGTVLARQPSQAGLIGRPALPEGMSRSLESNKPHFTETRGTDGIPRLYAVVPSLFDGRPFFYVFVGIDKSSLAHTAAKSLAVNLSALALIVLLSIAGTWMLSRRFLLRPLRQMITAAQGVSAGDLRTRTDLNHEVGEIGELAMHFDEMAQALETREQANQSANHYIEYIAQHDPLTNLPNRRLLDLYLEQQTTRAKAAGKPLAILFLNLDRFRLVNDSMGRAIGDRLLLTVAERLKEKISPESMVAHLGRDEFVCIIPDLGVHDDMMRVAHALIQHVTEPFFIGGERIEIGATVGISLFPSHSEDGPMLLSYAEVAMHEAKESAMPLRLYSPDIGAVTVKRREMETDLRRALTNHEFLLVYQPKLHVKNKHIVGAEALMRWRHPEKGLLSPAGYINLAEETQLIVPIGDWALRAACIQNKAWQDAGLPPTQIAVNVSPHQFKRPEFLSNVKRALDESGLDARYLEIEITESAFLHLGRDVLHELRHMGIELAIDDFGTGYSNLGYLKELPVDKLKIDQSFVRDIVRDPNDFAVTKAIINIAKSLKMKVVAEGVEDRQAFEILEQLNCDEIQGYYCGMPQLPEEFGMLLQGGYAAPHDARKA